MYSPGNLLISLENGNSKNIRGEKLGNGVTFFRLERINAQTHLCCVKSTSLRSTFKLYESNSSDDKKKAFGIFKGGGMLIQVRLNHISRITLKETSKSERI